MNDTSYIPKTEAINEDIHGIILRRLRAHDTQNITQYEQVVCCEDSEQVADVVAFYAHHDWDAEPAQHAGAWGVYTFYLCRKVAL